MESLDRARRWEKRVNMGWSDAWEATLRAMYSSDGKTLLNQETRANALRSMVENEARPDHAQIKSPVLMVTVINPYGGIAHRFQAFPEEKRTAINDFLHEARQMKEKELDLFHKAIPRGQTLVLTNADHHCFIDREEEVFRKMKTFLPN
jgi:hypothetical protein